MTMTMKDEIRQSMIESVRTTGNGLFINTDGIRYDMNGQGMADYMESIGYTVLRNWESSRNGFVQLDNGILISTNGYVQLAKI